MIRVTKHRSFANGEAIDMDWQDEANCKGYDTEVFFPVDDFTHPQLDAEQRKQVNRDNKLRSQMICSGCPVTASCLEYATEHRIADGHWGGMTQNQRDIANHPTRGAAVGVQRYRAHANPQSERGRRIATEFRSGAAPAAIALRYGATEADVRAEARRHLTGTAA